MKKLFLLFIALISSMLNNAMSTKKVEIEEGTITKMFLSGYEYCVAYKFVEQKTNKTTRIVYDSKIYQGIIRHDKSNSETMQDQTEMKAAFEKFKSLFNAAQNKK
jgi:hypothetical protein